MSYRHSLNIDAITSAPQLPNLWFYPPQPPPNPAELLALRTCNLISQLREQYDHIVIDTPNLSVTDAVCSLPRRCRRARNRSGQTTRPPSAAPATS